MGNWQLIRELVKGTGFYKRQFLFFCLITLAAVLVIFIFRVQSYYADELPVSANSLFNEPTINLDLTIAKDGRIFYNNRAVSYVELDGKHDILRYKILDKPEIFVNALQVTVRFPTPLPTQDTERKVIATHYDTGMGSVVGADFIDNRTIVYSGYYLSPDTIFTVYARFPKGVIQPPWWRVVVSAVTHLPFSIWLVLALLLPLTTLATLTIMLIKRWLILRPIKSSPLAKPPDALPPAAVGVLIHGRVGAREIAATLLDLAARGYLHLYQDNGEFYFGRGKALESEKIYELPLYERLLLNKIFTPTSAKSSQSDIGIRLGQKLFSRKMAQVLVEIYELIQKQGFFQENPGLVHQRYKLAGLGLLFAGLAGFIINTIFNREATFLLFFWVSMSASAILIISLSPYMPALTPRGKEARTNWLRFRVYLCQKNVASYQEELADPYNAYLPYAIVLRAETAWTRHFLTTPFHLPNWYGANQPISSIEDFANNLFPLVAFVARSLISSRLPVVD